MRKSFGTESSVVTDEHARSGFLRAHHVTRYRARNLAHIFVRKIIGDDAAPSIGPKFNRSHDTFSRTGFRLSAFEFRQPETAHVISASHLQQPTHLLSLKPLHDLAHILRAVPRTQQQRIVGLDHN